MDEEISIIDSNTRNEKIKNFLTNNKKKIISSVLILVILVIGIYSIDTYKKRAKLKLADKYNFAVINFKPENSQKIIEDLTEIVKANNTTYSTLALYFSDHEEVILLLPELKQIQDKLIYEAVDSQSKRSGKFGHLYAELKVSQISKSWVLKRNAFEIPEDILLEAEMEKVAD